MSPLPCLIAPVDSGVFSTDSCHSFSTFYLLSSVSRFDAKCCLFETCHLFRRCRRRSAYVSLVNGSKSGICGRAGVGST